MYDFNAIVYVQEFQSQEDECDVFVFTFFFRGTRVDTLVECQSLRSTLQPRI